MPLVFVDTGPIWSFTVVGRLDILEARVPGGVWTTFVKREIQRKSQSVPGLRPALEAAWPGEPYDVTERHYGGDGLVFLADAEDLKNGLDTDEDDHPMQHMGEAECILGALRVDGAELVVEDYDAYRLAKARGLRVRRTVDIFQEAVVMDDITCNDAWRLYQDMRTQHDRRLPDISKRELCDL